MHASASLASSLSASRASTAAASRRSEANSQVPADSQPSRSKLFHLWQGTHHAELPPVSAWRPPLPSPRKQPGSSTARAKAAGIADHVLPQPHRGPEAAAHELLALLPAEDVPKRRGLQHIQAVDKMGVDALHHFRDAMKRKWGSLVRAWRLYLDSKANNRVPFVDFSRAVRAAGFPDVKRIWHALDTNGSGFATLDKWDPSGYHTLHDFRARCLKQYADMHTAFRVGMDIKKAQRVPFDRFRDFCRQMLDWLGDVDPLFRMIDTHHHNFIRMEDLEFLAHMEGERFEGVGMTVDSTLRCLRSHKEKTLRPVRLDPLCRLQAVMGWDLGPSTAEAEAQYHVGFLEATLAPSALDPSEPAPIRAVTAV